MMARQARMHACQCRWGSGFALTLCRETVPAAVDQWGLLHAERVQKTTAANLGISLLFIKTCAFFHNPTKIISSVQFSAQCIELSTCGMAW
jgi:hypothetical protein